MSYPEIFLDQLGIYKRTTRQCDCACSQYKLSSMSTSINKIDDNKLFIFDDKCISIDYNEKYKILHSPSFNASPVVLNKSALAILDEFKNARTIRSFCENSQAANDTCRKILTHYVKYGILRPAHSPSFCVDHSIDDVLIAWIQITDKCNLACKYCYMNNEGHVISASTGRRIVDQIARIAEKRGFKTIKFKYSGGEPLLSINQLLEIHQYAQNKFRNKFEFKSIVLSNGTLIANKVIQTLLNHKIGIMISLDGFEHYHNINRPFKNGNGSYSYVKRGLEIALRNNLKPDISITVNEKTIDGLFELVVYLADKQIPFSINFEKPVRSFDKLTGKQTEQFILKMKSFYKRFMQVLPAENMISNLLDLIDFAAPHCYCCKAGHSYLVYDTEGKISPCQMMMTTKVSDIHDDDPLDTIEERYKQLFAPVEEKNTKCTECDLRYWCAGGCPLLSSQDPEMPSYYCDIYRSLYSDVLKLEAARLIMSGACIS